MYIGNRHACYSLSSEKQSESIVKQYLQCKQFNVDLHFLSLRDMFRRLAPCSRGGFYKNDKLSNIQQTKYLCPQEKWEWGQRFTKIPDFKQSWPQRGFSSLANNCDHIDKNTIKAGGSTATKMWTGWVGEWVIPLWLLQLLEHLAVLKRQITTYFNPKK